MASHDAPSSDERLVDDTLALVERWLQAAHGHETRRSKRTMDRLHGVIVDPEGLAFVMAFVDRVARPDDDRVAAAQLRSVLVEHPVLPGFLGPVDRALLRLGARLSSRLPAVVMPLARRRMRALVGHLVAPAAPDALRAHLAHQRHDGWASNVNLLGEAVLGSAEADRRQSRLLTLLDHPDVDYVSVKPSSVVAQLNPWAWEASLDAVTERLGQLVEQAAHTHPPTFVNVDMEEHHDLHLTLAAFERVLGDPRHRAVEAGIVLQAYLPESFTALQRLAAWAAERAEAGGAPIKVRLVKGANLAMERVEAAMHGWEAAPYDTKAETDANYLRCLDWVLDPEHLAGLQVGVASHNLFHVAWATLVAEQRGVGDRIQVEMLQGMAEAQAAAVADTLGADHRPLLYTPAVDPADFDVAIGYLFRRLDENAAPDNFLRALFDLAPGSPALTAEAERFRRAVADRHTVRDTSRRTQDRRAPIEPRPLDAPFANEAETDPTVPENRDWIEQVRALEPWTRRHARVTDPLTVAAAAGTAREAGRRWHRRPADERRAVLHRVADELGARRALLLRTMADECGKPFAEGDIEVCEAIDFARYYGDRILDLDRPRVRFEPFGVVAVVPPWNFPVAIPAGGVLAALAAGNGVVFKPAPEAVRCAEVIVDALRAAGVPDDLVTFTPTGDDDAGRRVIETADAVILTGSTDTADLFRGWNPALRLFAETSGKNALVITPRADIDLAVADLVRSAVGHAGQKCSAASLAICVGGVADNPRFRRQLVDAVETLAVGPADDPATVIGPLIGPPNPRLERGLHTLDAGESWLVEPRLLDAATNRWRPGVRLGVRPGSWYHRTECFGPVLGIIEADTLDDAIAIQNAGDAGLTGGIHTLDPSEIDRWTAAVEVGNAYVNRPITGAIVQRQPFGGWKRSSVGPGAKAGGPNYVAQLGTWLPAGDEADAGDDYAEVWRTHVAVEHDPSGLFCESNVFRYRPLSRIVVRHGPDTPERDLTLARRAAEVAGVELIDSDARTESDTDLAARLPGLGVERVRVVGVAVSTELQTAANAAGVHLADQPVVADGRIELLHLVREQSVSTTRHRFGNLPPHQRG